MKAMRILAVYGVALLMFWAGPAFADELTVFGAGSRSAAMAGAGAALLDDSYAAHANPAGMTLGQPGVSVGFVGAANRLQVRLADRPAGYDLPDLGASSPAIPSRYRLTRRESESRAPGFSGFTVGATISGGIDWLRVGVLAFIPTTGIGNQNSYYADEREQYFSNTVHQAIYGERLSTQQTLIAAAVRPISWLSVGAGMRFAVETRSDNHIFVPGQADNSVQYIDMRTETGVATAPVVSAATLLHDDRLHVSLTWRGELESSLRGANTVQINGFQGTPQYPFRQPMNIIADYAPHQVLLSGAWKDDSFAATLDTTWSQWSGYRDDTDNLAGFHDTVSAAAGVEGRVTKRSVVRGGLGFRPSPVPEQVGRTNYADNSMWIFGLGFGHEVEIDGATLDISAYGQVHAAVPRSHTKAFSSNAPACAEGVTALCDEIPDDIRDPVTGKEMPEVQGLQTGNPGFPGWSSGGWIAVAGIQVSWRYR
jgi:hypothetical protein